MARLNSEELETLKANTIDVKSAKLIAEQLASDPTSGGVFPKGDEGNFEEVDYEKFKEKWCGW